MLPDKVIKEKYKPTFWKTPEKFYAVEVLKEEGFLRNKCKKCGKPFWSVDKRNVCGDPACSNEEYGFIGKKGKDLSYTDVWKKYTKMFEKFEYSSIKRYPSVSRWNPTMEYTNSSIAAFQPFVVSGEVEPPANPLVIPQFCLRFLDTDNVGVTMSHMTGFVMIGQHQFGDWDQNKVFRHMLEWNRKGMGIKDKDVTFHEDAWAGGGNVGCCMEMFSKGNEIWNQVYMLYEQTPKGVKSLNTKVLDMGMGQERCAWYSQGSNTIYDATFPHVLNKLLNKTGYKIDKKLLKKFVPNGGMLNFDEVDNMDKAWKVVAKRVGVDVKELKEKILPLSGIYSVAEHMRGMLFAISDGALPSNVGGGYNLRMLVRRCLSFIDRYGWDVNLPEVCEWHSQELKKLFPELKDSMEEVRKILDIEKIKYDNTKARAKNIVDKLGKVNEKELMKLYDSQGISPEMAGVKVPENFYAKVAELHEQKEFVGKTGKEEVEIKGIDDTKILYYDDYKKVSFSAEVLFVKGDNVVLDQSAFYPTSGGQLHDLGTLNGKEVVNVWKQGGWIVHKVKGLKKGEKVKGKIDLKRRKLLAVHHTATHVVNAAAKKVLGRHINQAGAFKDVDKARLDITHYDSVTNEELTKIEEEANKIVKKGLKVESRFLPRNEAEKKYGMVIYQGGAVPGKMIRIIDVKGEDIEACGGTHLGNTKDIVEIKLLKSTKVQDGVVRLVYVAGDAAKKVEKEEGSVVKDLAKELGCNENEIVGRAKELFKLWKLVVKKKKDVPKKLVSKEKFDGDVLLETCNVLKTQPEHVLNTVKRFKKELGI